ncbi:hypothetical protein GGR54DRAFT_376773 [Hypoxylon sp. NC1633]|nr:hypothetical protein GGR54DRAFT_376773 [Hypoxylon sp. NC1633]
MGALQHVSESLETFFELINYDKEHPVHWSEVSLDESAQSQLPDERWLIIKLKSIRPCLIFLVRLLRLILYKCSDTWDECEESMYGNDWFYQFILDTPKLLENSISTSPPETYFLLSRRLGTD